MPLQATSGAASYDAFGGGAAAAVPQYIEDVFSTYLYTGTGSARTITNDIDLSTKGGLVWIKGRSAGTNNNLFDTAQGTGNLTHSNTTSATISDTNSLTAFNTTGFSLGSGNTTGSQVNSSAVTYASWTFRKQPKFFDIVTYTGNGASTKVISHNLKTSPSFIILKSTSDTSEWSVYSASVAGGIDSSTGLKLNTAGWQEVQRVGSVTSTTFTVGSAMNLDGSTYIAYLFASNAGGFGLTGTDNIITCGSYTGNGSATGPIVTLGYEPQWVMIKRFDAFGGQWNILDSMRGMTVGANDNLLFANAVGAEDTTLNFISPLSTGFQLVTTNSEVNDPGGTYVYIAIRRGPMKVPTSGTEVFATVARSGTGSSTALTSPNIVTDMAWIKQRTGYDNPIDATRLIGPNKILFQNSTNAEVTDSTTVTAFDSMTGYTVGTGSRVNASGSTYANWVFKRAPSVFDVVCYTGTGTAQTLTHNLGTTPELFFTKPRSYASNWFTYSGFAATNRRLYLEQSWGYDNANTTSSNIWNSTAPTATTFTVGGSASTSGQTYVAYLFATCAGVSKVGSYTGTGTLTTINCGFTGGARFVMIKRADSTGSWYIWDTARGMVAGTDPSLMINDSEIEVNANSVYTASTGFQLLASPSVDINTSGGTYIFLAMA